MKLFGYMEKRKIRLSRRNDYKKNADQIRVMWWATFERIGLGNVKRSTVSGDVTVGGLAVIVI